MIINGLSTKQNNGAFGFTQTKNMQAYLDQFDNFVTRSISKLHTRMCVCIIITTAY